MMPEVKSVCREQFGGAFEAEGLSRTGVQLPGNSIEFRLREATQVSSLGEVLPEQAVGIFVDAALPWAVRIGKVNFHPSSQRQALVLGHLLALIVGQRKSLLRFNAIENVTEATQRGLGAGILHSRQHGEQRRAFHQRTNRRAVACALDEVAFPMTRSQVIFNIRWSVMNADHVGNTTAPIVNARPRTAFGCLGFHQRVIDLQEIRTLSSQQVFDLDPTREPIVHTYP